MYQGLSWFILTGFLVPSFGDYMYYYQTEEADISQFQYSMISVASYIAMFVGIVIYKSFLSSYESRTMLCISCVIGMVGSFFSLVLVLQWNLKIGISNLVFVYFTDTFTVALA
mmetsp:Transcript_14061/g.9898  ORF Transcript_14061/g.9898 Transcript_14061/m.9898 type:complete len:113 (+) Transcript_14061:816-1154(+)